MNNIIEEELKDYMKQIEDFDKDNAQDASALHSYLIQISNWQARANYLMAEYQRKFRQQKTVAYYNMAANQKAQNKYFSASQGKDFIDAQCSETGYIFDLAERLSRLCTHTGDSLRTIISSLKSERVFSQYQPA